MHNFKLVCTVCNCAKEARRVQPYRRGVWTTIGCTQGKKQFPAHQWMCTCMANWRSCELHHSWQAHANVLRITRRRPKKTANASRGVSSNQIDTLHNIRTLSSQPKGHSNVSATKRKQPSNCIGQPFEPRLFHRNMSLSALAKMPKLAQRFAHLREQSSGEFASTIGQAPILQGAAESSIPNTLMYSSEPT
mmetsp:Transcript_56136/g.87417  ORF Transcript_56136/g.87417 Transcript_56136/m.87417 type:complete len:191 (-) Transcript_56136:21-593(-)